MRFFRRATTVATADSGSPAPARLFPFVPVVALSLALAVTLAACGEHDAATGASASGDSVPVAGGGGRGAEVYASSCASCHGAGLEGTEKGPSQLSIVYEPNHHPDSAYESAIRNGAPQHHWDFGDMPPVEGLSDDDIDVVISFIRAEQERRGLTP